MDLKLEAQANLNLHIKLSQIRGLHIVRASQNSFVVIENT